MENLKALDGKDEIKFVIASRRDYEFARDFVAQHDLAGPACGRFVFARVCRSRGRLAGLGCAPACGVDSGGPAAGAARVCSCTNSSGILQLKEFDAAISASHETDDTTAQGGGAAERGHGFVRHCGDRNANRTGWPLCTRVMASAPSGASGRRSTPSPIFWACQSGWRCGWTISGRLAVRR